MEHSSDQVVKIRPVVHGSHPDGITRKSLNALFKSVGFVLVEVPNVILFGKMGKRHKKNNK